MTEKLEPTPEEYAYNLGQHHYQQGLSVSLNPYSVDDENTRYSEFERGWMNAQLEDKKEAYGCGKCCDCSQAK